MADPTNPYAGMSLAELRAKAGRKPKQPRVVDRRPDLAPQPAPRQTADTRWNYPGGNALDDRQDELNLDPNAPAGSVGLDIERGLGPTIEKGYGINVNDRFTSRDAAHRYFMQNRGQREQPQHQRPDPARQAAADAQLAASATARGGAVATPKADQQRHAQGRKAAAAARRQGFNVTYDEKTGQLDESKHDARAEGRRLRKIARLRAQGKPDPGGEDAAGGPIRLALPPDQIDPSVFEEGQQYSYGGTELVFQNGELAVVPPPELSIEEQRERRLQDELAFKRQTAESEAIAKEIRLNMTISDFQRRMTESGVLATPDETDQRKRIEMRVIRIEEKFKAASEELTFAQDDLNALLSQGRGVDQDDLEDAGEAHKEAARRLDIFVKRRGELEAQLQELEQTLMQRAGETAVGKAWEAVGKGGGQATPAQPAPAQQAPAAPTQQAPAAPAQQTFREGRWSQTTEDWWTDEEIAAEAQKRGVSVERIESTLGLTRVKGR